MVTVGPDWGAMDLKFQTDHKSLRQLSVATSGNINEVIVRIQGYVDSALTDNPATSKLSLSEAGTAQLVITDAIPTT